jgi:hypothetical protein
LPIRILLSYKSQGDLLTSPLMYSMFWENQWPWKDSPDDLHKISQQVLSGSAG